MPKLLSQKENLPPKLKTPAVLPYYELLCKKRGTLIVKRLLDFIVCSLVFILVSPFFLIFAFLVKVTSPGPVFFKQERIGRDLKPFYILKFRTMVKDADKQGVQLTTGNDSRITGFGKFLRAINMDEMPQLINVIKGDMSIIGTRPEVERYVSIYTDEMYATLLLAPGMLSRASVKYRNENELLTGAADPQQVYINEILPDKMAENLAYLKELSLKEDFVIIMKSIACMFK